MNRYIFTRADFSRIPHMLQSAIENEEPFIGSFYYYIGTRKRTSRRDIITTNSLVGEFLEEALSNIWERNRSENRLENPDRNWDRDWDPVTRTLNDQITIFVDQEVEKRIVNLVLWKYDERQEQIDLMNANIKTLTKIDGITKELAKMNDNLIELMAKIAWKHDIKHFTNQAGSLDEEELLIDEE